MNRNLILLYILIALAFTLSLIIIESFNYTNAQVDSYQEQIEPIPPSNNTNPDNISPMINVLLILDI
jgi:hypothetical protein